MKKVSITLLALIVFSKVFFPQATNMTQGKVGITANSTAAATDKKNLKLDDIWGNPQFSARTVSELSSMKDGERYTDVNENGILIYDYKSGNLLDTLVSTAMLEKANGGKFDFTGYSLSDDETKVLFTASPESIYRHSFRAEYYIYDRKSGTLTPLSNKGKQMYATFSPQGNRIAFVRDNNIFIKDLLTGEEKQITTDGKKNLVINGATDWVYEEEFSFDRAFEWNVDGSCLAYYRFDESDVKEYTLTYYDSLYPRLETYKYPKAGEKNSTVDLFIYSVNTAKKTRISSGSENDQYIPRIKWTKDPNTLSYLRMNRHQMSVNSILHSPMQALPNWSSKKKTLPSLRSMMI